MVDPPIQQAAASRASHNAPQGHHSASQELHASGMWQRTMVRPSYTAYETMPLMPPPPPAYSYVAYHQPPTSDYSLYGYYQPPPSSYSSYSYVYPPPPTYDSSLYSHHDAATPHPSPYLCPPINRLPVALAEPRIAPAVADDGRQNRNHFRRVDSLNPPADFLSRDDAEAAVKRHFGSSLRSAKGDSNENVRFVKLVCNKAGCKLSLRISHEKGNVEGRHWVEISTKKGCHEHNHEALFEKEAKGLDSDIACCIQGFMESRSSLGLA
jgi:hypothetical protein